MTVRGFMSTTAAAIVATMLALPANARAKKQKRSDAQKRYDVQTPSLDGRITAGLVPADTTRFNTTDWEFPTDPTAIEAKQEED